MIKCTLKNQSNQDGGRNNHIFHRQLLIDAESINHFKDQLDVHQW